ncbi:ABC transporter ATP-binding protein [Oerskovia enterophila]|uniref:Oligopeptide transport ATP-binding protein OppF n=1 Tax=Oerskovia enterophila TaxID=43678 RepID=A0A163RNL2_9CELL|nr:ATP-binding cassette domain-containing protein [Oerskovia enterophila]KZM35525.1 oligopeptide transport ATP-binding protein OppF [Oerskovia enterophila]OCI30830.1 oligopeptide transport ATP-binding protein OppF [Oerskovia enterophila]
MSTLEVKNLTKDFRIRGGRGSRTLRAVDDVSFTLEPGKTIAVVGESGSGKSTVARMIAKLEKPSSGEILIDGRKSATRGRALAEYRRNVQMVFQDPFASLNPFHTIAHHIERPLRLHGKAKGREEIDEQVHQLLERVNLTPAPIVAARRPHELSGGQRQRVAIARALAPGARFLVADEPVSMLDVSIRLSVLNLLARLQREENLGVLYITHDLATARHFSDEIIVMFRGKVVERGPSDDVILDPQHDYTKLLLGAAPNPESHGRLRDEVRRELASASATSGDAGAVRDRFGTADL